MQECFIRLIVFHKFSQIKRNKSQQSRQLYVKFHLKLNCPAVEEKNHLIQIKMTTKIKNNITKL